VGKTYNSYQAVWQGDISPAGQNCFLAGRICLSFIETIKK